MKQTSLLLCTGLMLLSAIGTTVRVLADDTAVPTPFQPASNAPGGLWSHGNLFAWCASVPFDSKQRNSEDRAVMLQKLGFNKFAYNWRGPAVLTFDAEIEAMQKHRIEIIA